MKKFLALVIMATLCISIAVSGGTSVAAENSAYSTSSWKPHKYVASMWDIPTAMTYDAAAGSVSFEGSLNAGIATTGFTSTEPVDIDNFSIKMSFDLLQDPQDISWITFALFDATTITNTTNLQPVYAPFNVGDGLTYQTSPFTGLLIMLQPQGDGVFNVYSVIAKRIDITTGEFVENGWNQYATENFVGVVNLNSDNYNDIKLSVSAEGETGLAINFNDGAWTDENGGVQTKINTGTDLSAVRKYFNDNSKKAYFQFVTMYKVGDHRDMKFTVKEMNGKKASDGTAPSYLAEKTLTDGSITAVIGADSVGICGVYPETIDSINVTKFTSSDGNYADVMSRATSLGMEKIDYFRVVPQIGTTTVKINAAFTVNYTLPTGYTSYKIYYVNSDDEVVSMPSAMASIAGQTASVKVDNATISKVIIYGAKEVPVVEKSGCGSIITADGGSGSGIILMILAVAVAGAFISVKSKKINIKKLGE